MLSWNMRCRPSFSTWLCEKTSFSENLIIFSIVRLRFNCFLIFLTCSCTFIAQMFCCVARSKIIFLMWICKKTTCTGKKFRVVGYTLACSQVWFIGMKIFVEIGGVKPSYFKPFEVILEWTNLLGKNLYLILLHERLKVLKYGNSAHAGDSCGGTNFYLKNCIWHCSMNV